MPQDNFKNIKEIIEAAYKLWDEKKYSEAEHKFR